MKLTETELKNLINQEIQLMIESGDIDEGVLGSLAKGASRMARRAQGALQSKVAGAIGADDMAAKGKAKQAYATLIGDLESLWKHAASLGLTKGATKNQQLVDAIKQVADVVKASASAGNLKYKVGDWKNENQERK